MTAGRGGQGGRRLHSLHRGPGGAALHGAGGEWSLQRRVDYRRPGWRWLRQRVSCGAGRRAGWLSPDQLPGASPPCILLPLPASNTAGGAPRAVRLQPRPAARLHRLLLRAPGRAAGLCGRRQRGEPAALGCLRWAACAGLHWALSSAAAKRASLHLAVPAERASPLASTRPPNPPPRRCQTATRPSVPPHSCAAVAPSNA